LSKKFLNINGRIYPANSRLFGTGNRAFRYGDALFETIRIINGEACFLSDHFSRLKYGMTVLKMNIPDFFEELYFENEIKELLVKNGITEGGRVRLTVFRNDGGLYTPETNDVSYVLEGYSLNKKSLYA